MAEIRTIVKEGDPILHQQAQVVRRFNDSLHRLLDDMMETMHQAEGCGLAAPQVGISKRVIVVDDGEHPPMEMVNPVIVRHSGAVEAVEYCLSVPDRGGKVIRAQQITVEYQDRNGNPCQAEYSDFYARIFQHEIDHLDGKLFTDVMIEEVRD